MELAPLKKSQWQVLYLYSKAQIKSPEMFLDLFVEYTVVGRHFYSKDVRFLW